MGSPLGIRHRVRRLVERLVPWFDREQADRERAQLRREIEASRAVRARATRTMLRDGYQAYAERMGGRR